MTIHLAAPGRLADQNLTSMILGHMQSRIIHAAVEIGVIDALGAEPISSDQLARNCRCEPGATLRLMHSLVALGLAHESEPDRFVAAIRADPLRSDARSSLRNLVLMLGSERAWNSWAHIGYSVRTGIPASHFLYDMTSDEYLAKNEGAAALHAAAMGEIAHRVADALVEGHDFAGLDSIVDIGGSDFVLLTRILAACPGLDGTLFGQAGRLHEAESHLDRAGLRGRCQFVAGGVFEAMPAGRGGYLMKNVLRDWTDERCVAILKRVRDAMRQDSELLLVERLMPQQLADCTAHHLAALTDMNLLVMTGGRQRTLSHFDRLLAESSLRRTNEVVPLQGTSEWLLVVTRTS